MPNPGFTPNQPGYYTFRNKFGNMSYLLGGKIDDTVPDDEAIAAKASEENYRAYVTSNLPWKASPEDVIARALEIAPELQIDEAQQENRRQLSEKARQAIVNTGARRAFTMDGRPIIDRLDSCFYYRGNSIDVKERNNQVQQQLRGTPEDRGRMLQDRVNNIYELYQRVLNHDVKDDELIERLEDFHILQNLVMCAENFLNGTKPNEKTGQPYISVSPELGKILKDMERNSSEIFYFVDRVRIIANPNYEFLDLDRMMDLETQKFHDLFDYAAMESDDIVLDDAAQFVESTRSAKTTIGRDNMMKRIVDDFPEEYENARIEFVGFNGKVYGMQYTTKHHNTTIEDNLHKGGVLVTVPSGKTICYHLDNTTGRVREADTSVVFAEVAASAASLLTDLQTANEGFFIGSKEYRKTLVDMPEVLKSVSEVGNPPDPEKMSQASVKLRETLENVEKYLKNKERGHDSYSSTIAKMSKSGRSRYDTMLKVADYCKMQLNVYALKRQEMTVEKLGGIDPIKNLSELDALSKAHQMYGTNEIPATNVGNIADELRADISQSLSHMLTAEGFDKDEACDTFSNMVLLEVVKRGRFFDEFTGDLAAGALERKLAETPGPVVRSMRETPYIKAVTENMDLDMFRQLVTLDRAKTLADQFIKAAKEYVPNNKVEEIQKQNEQEMQQQKATNSMVK